MKKNITVGLVGNPNSGKTTLFNALTRSKQRVGNWAGVTVEKKSGYFNYQDTLIEVVDLPGTYNLTVVSEAISLDEKIACDFILSDEADLIINIVDATNLERNLYLTTQLLEMDIPVIIVLTMLDVAKQRDIEINKSALAQALKCSVIPIEIDKQNTIKNLKEKIIREINCQRPSESFCIPYPTTLLTAKNKLEDCIQQKIPNRASQASWIAIRLLEDDGYAMAMVNQEIMLEVKSQQKTIQQQLLDDADIHIADSRYSFIHEITSKITSRPKVQKQSLTHKVDKVILNRFLGIPIFLLVMYLMFLFAINIGGAFQDFFDISSNTIFVQGLSYSLIHLGVSPWVTALLASGIGKGINTTITFAPIIGAMFLFLSFLEDSGYMARAAFVMDRLMRAVGLPGKSFVPLIVGFGCNVPAIMSTRTLENKRDRILTVMMSPFMSCGARLAIFAVFTAAFFPKGGQNIVFGLYLIGIFSAVMTGLILRKTLLKGDPSPMVMELPPYHLPKFTVVLRNAWNRLKNFLWKAGRLIIPICVLVGALNAINLDGSLNFDNASSESLLSYLGQWLTPIFHPMGLQANNWPATVGLLTGVLAKEVVIATLNTLYTQVGHLAVAAQYFNFWSRIHDALLSIPQNLKNLPSAFSNPILASAPQSIVNQGVFGVMYQRFNGQVGAFAYLLFVLLYIPCVSSSAVMARELGRYWALFSIFWNTSLAYAVAVIFYQLATLMRHPQSSLIWVMGIFLFFVGVLLSMKLFADLEDKSAKNTELRTEASQC